MLRPHLDAVWSISLCFRGKRARSEKIVLPINPGRRDDICRFTNQMVKFGDESHVQHEKRC